MPKKPGKSRYSQLRVSSSDQGSNNITPIKRCDTETFPKLVFEDGAASDEMCLTHPSRITAKFSSNSKEDIDLSFLTCLPNLQHAFADAYMEVVCRRQLGYISKKQMAISLRQGFVTWAIDVGLQNISLKDITTHTVNQFIDWLTKRRTVNGKSISRSTRKNSLIPLRHIISSLRESPRWMSDLSPRVTVRTNPWPDSPEVATPTPIMTYEEWKDLYNACVDDVRATVEYVESLRKRMEACKDVVPKASSGHTAFADVGIFLAAIDRYFPNHVPTRPDISKVSKGLARAFTEFHPLRCTSALHPYVGDILPFVILMGMYTLFNSEVLLTLKRSAIIHQSVLGVDRIRISAYKARSNADQARSFAVDPAPESLSSIIAFLDRWTERLRPVVPSDHVDRVFLFVPATRLRSPRSYHHAMGASGDSTFTITLKTYLNSRGLGTIHHRMIRATGLDLVHDLFSGDLRAVQAAGGQKSPQTILDHYTSGAARKRNDERLGKVMNTRERWQSSSGRVDPRGTPATHDLGACTPGWSCADPYASLIPGERAGRLCAAFGACPNCPLALIDTASPHTLACLLALKSEIEAARSYLEPTRWISAWAPRLDRLHEYWLPAFTDPSVLNAAAGLSMPPFPRLD